MTDDKKDVPTDVEADLEKAIDEVRTSNATAEELDDKTAEGDHGTRPVGAAHTRHVRGGCWCRSSSASCWSSRQAFATWIYFTQYRPDQRRTSRLPQTSCKAASDGTVALLSYYAGHPGQGLREREDPPDR